MTSYRIRAATLDDLEVLAHHRVAMFEEMGVHANHVALADEFVAWCRTTMADGTYRGWLVEEATGVVVAGGGATVLPWPPGPVYRGGRIAFVYNVYTEPAHRGRGLARLIMEGIHEWCRTSGIRSVALSASQFGQPLYESMGYRVSPSPTMVLTLESD